MLTTSGLARPRVARGVLTAAVAAPLLMASPHAACPVQGWTLLQAPVVPAGATSTIFLGASCTVRTACVAVGYDIGSNGLSGSLAERWDGTRWTLQATPARTDSSLSSVSCTSAHSCTAVGDYYATRSFRTLAEHWDGTTWTVQATPNQGGLDSVDCTAASSCMAVGGTSAERWDGRTWRLLSTGGATDEVSCTSGRSCMAVGDTFGTTMYSATWDGATWTSQPVSLPAGFADGLFNTVSCGGAGGCVGVGGYGARVNHRQAFSQTWDGTTWTVQRTAALASALQSELDGLACPRAGACEAVGWVRKSGQAYARPLAEHWDGRDWTTQHTTLLPPGTGGGYLVAASCSSTVYCLAVGYYHSAATGSDTAFAEQKLS